MPPNVHLQVLQTRNYVELGKVKTRRDLEQGQEMKVQLLASIHRKMQVWHTGRDRALLSTAQRE